MAIAGKVAITPRGIWTNASAYTKLDFVTHNGVAYVALKPSAGIEPPNEEYWMVSLDNTEVNTEIEQLKSADETIQALQVDNATTNLFDSNLEFGSLTSEGNEQDSLIRLRSVDFINVVPNMTYTISAKPLDDEKQIKIMGHKYKSDGTFVEKTDWHNDSLTFTIADTVEKVRFIFGYVDDARIYGINEITDIQLELGSEATEYVPHYRTVKQLDADLDSLESSVQNGITQTTSPIMEGSVAGGLKVVELDGKTEQVTSTGKNLLKNTATSQTVNGVTFTVNDDGSVTANGTPTSRARFIIPFDLGGDFILSGSPYGGSTTTYSIYAYDNTVGSRIKDQNGNITDNEVGNGIQISPIAGHDNRVVLDIFEVETNVNNLTFYPMIRLATDSDPTFEPYTGGAPSPSPDYPQDIKGALVDSVRTHGKNCLNPDYFADNTVINGFDANSSIGGNSQYWTTGYQKVLPGVEYIFNVAVAYKVNFYDSSKNVLYTSRDVDGPFIVPEKAQYIIASFHKGRAAFGEAWLEFGTETTAYEPYQESSITLTNPITLYGNDSIKDRIVEKDGVFGVERKIWKAAVKFDSDLSQTSNGTTRYSVDFGKEIVNGNLAKTRISKSNILSTYDYNDEHGYEHFYYSTASRIIVYVDENFNPEENLYEFLAELATPTFEPLPDADQKALRNLKTFDGVTYLEFYSDREIGVDPDIVVEYGLNKTSGYVLEMKNKVDALSLTKRGKIYGMHIDGNESDPSSMITYIADSVGMIPAFMDYTTDKFNYGSWKDAWFIEFCRPCVLNQDGTVRAYLDKNDQTKDINGNSVVIDENLSGANVMIEFPKIWYKIVPHEDKTYDCYFAEYQVDSEYVDYAYIDNSGKHKEHFYLPAYNSANIDNVLRSLSGQQVSKKLTAQQEIDRCKANGEGWYTEDAGEIMLVNLLLILIGKSTDTQTVFGKGLCTGGTEAINDGFKTGVHNQKGLFYGTNNDAAATYTNAVKVFGIENWWGFQWRRYAGDILDNGKLKIKLCYGTEDGSTVSDFNLTGEGYVDVGVTPSGTSSGYINEMKFTKSGMYSVVSNGTSSTFYTDGQWFNNSGVRYALRGGSSNNGLRVGALCVARSNAVSYAAWDRGASPSYK